MTRKREQPENYTSEPSKLASEIEDEIAGHDFDEWNCPLIFYNGEMRMIVKALRKLEK